MGDKRQKNQLSLAFVTEGRSETSMAVAEGTEPSVAKRELDGPAETRRLMEEVCQRDNLIAALNRVQRNAGSPGVDGMTVRRLTGYLKKHWPTLREQLLAGNIYVRSERAGQRVMEGITHFLTTKLKLKVNESKSAVARPWQRKFLGFSFTNGKEPKRRIAPKALDRFKERIRELTRRIRGISLARMIENLDSYLGGWRGYFGFCQTPSVLRDLDSWIRRRLRSVAWTQWKHGKRRYAELRARRVGYDLAAQTAGSPHGPWRISRSPALSVALPNVSWTSLGLPSLLPV
jgi:hypothetical protein